MESPIVQKKIIVAVVDIGTSGIRMVIAEIGPKSEIRYLENLHRSIRFGRDVFSSRRISAEGMREALEILRDFRVVMDEYNVNKVQAVATSAVREALNRDNFLDQIYVRTGIEVEVLEGPEENRLALMTVEKALGETISLSNKNALIIEVGAGSTEIILLNQGNVEVTRTLSLGSIRLPEQAEASKMDPSKMQKLLKRNIREIVSYAAREYSVDQVDHFIALGGDMRFVVEHLEKDISGKFAVIEKKDFTTFVTKVSRMSAADIAKEYHVAYDRAEALYPALLVYFYFLLETKAENMIVPMTSIRDGLLIECAEMFSGLKRTDFSKQVLNSARHLGAKYKYDKVHAASVGSLALKLFDLLQDDHGMQVRERLLLEISATLHSIGTYVSPSGYHKHSYYLIQAAEIFGLRLADKNIVANVVRYHRKSSPKATHVNYMSLPKADRAIVLKLAAILRIADALEISHQQRIRKIELTRTSNLYTIWVPADIGDISLERDALLSKGAMFGDVYGVPITLKLGSAPAGE